MRFAVINDASMVENIIVANDDFILPGFTLVKSDGLPDAVIGATWDGANFTAPIPVSPPPPGPMPLTSEQSQAVAFIAQNVVLNQLTAGTFDFSHLAKVVYIFPEWQVGIEVAIGDVYTYNGEIVQCLQAHTTQADWTPDVTPALWKTYRDSSVIAEWVQPDSTNPYRMGDKVTHNGKTWQSTNDANVWEPGTTGAPWTDITGT